MKRIRREDQWLILSERIANNELFEKVNLASSIFTSRVRNRVVELSAALGLALTIAQGAPGDSWSRDLIPAGHFPAPGVSFAIVSVGASESKITANAFYCYVQGRDAVTLHGKQNEDGFFKPNVAYEVAIEGKSKWKALLANSDYSSTDTATVSPEHARIVLSIDMRPLEPWIGIYRYARLTLENGDSAIVALEDLVPTASAQYPLGNFKEDVFGSPRPNVDKPGVLSTVISLGDRLIGEFIFRAEDKAVKLKGTRTLDGDFWPTATFETSNDGKKWTVVGKSQNAGTRDILEIKPGTAETVRFILTDYKTQTRKNRLGKITLSNGDSIEFYVDNLDPKN